MLDSSGVIHWNVRVKESEAFILNTCQQKYDNLIEPRHFRESFVPKFALDLPSIRASNQMLTSIILSPLFKLTKLKCVVFIALVCP